MQKALHFTSDFPTINIITVRLEREYKWYLFHSLIFIVETSTEDFIYCIRTQFLFLIYKQWSWQLTSWQFTKYVSECICYCLVWCERISLEYLEFHTLLGNFFRAMFLENIIKSLLLFNRFLLYIIIFNSIIIYWNLISVHSRLNIL